MRESLIERELGRLSEGLENAKADRAEMTRVVSKLDESVDAMRMALNGLTQTSQAVANQIHSIATEKCGERLDTIERDRKREAEELAPRLTKFESMIAESAENKRRLDAYQRICGSGFSLVVRIGLAMLGSTAGGALIAKFWH